MQMKMTDKTTIPAMAETPSTPEFINSRVAVLLAHYFMPEMEDHVKEGIFQDWCAALSRFPREAILEAVDWWISEHNPDRKRKPLPGDIAERAKSEQRLHQLVREARECAALEEQMK